MLPDYSERNSDEDCDGNYDDSDASESDDYYRSRKRRRHDSNRSSQQHKPVVVRMESGTTAKQPMFITEISDTKMLKDNWTQQLIVSEKDTPMMGKCYTTKVLAAMAMEAVRMKRLSDFDRRKVKRFR